MTKFNFSAYFIPVFLILLSLSFFPIANDDLRILFISGALMVVSLLTILRNLFLKIEQPTLNPITVLIFLWLIGICVPIASNLVQSTAQFGLFQCCAWVFSFFIIASCNNLDKNWHSFKKLICILGFIFSCWGIAQHYLLQNMATGPFNNRNSNGAFLMLAALIVCCKLLSAKNVIENKDTFITKYGVIIYSGSFLIINLGLLLSFSRGVYISYALSLIFLIGCNSKHFNAKKIIGLSSLILLAMLVLYLSAFDSILHRLDILGQEKSRSIIWQGAWHLWQKFPWIGIGIGNFKYFYPAFSLPGDGSSLEYAHNDYLQLLIETGIAGFTLLFALALVIFNYCRRFLNAAGVSPSTYITTTTQMAALLSLCMYGFVDYPFYTLPFNILEGAFLGFLYQSFANQKFISPLATTQIVKYTYQTLGIGLLVVITFWFSRLSFYTYHTNQAMNYITEGKFAAATSSYTQARQYLVSPYLYNKLASLYLERAKQTSSTDEQFKLINKVQPIIAENIARHPYNAEPHFQQGIIQALYYKDSTKAQAAFETFIHLRPQANFERLTFFFFLVEQDQFFYAQEILEQGLLYPITRNYAPKYLESLADLRAEHGDKLGAQQLLTALSHLEDYGFDFSAFAAQQFS